jgi:hypothetical protein
MGNERTDPLRQVRRLEAVTVRTGTVQWWERMTTEYI